MEPRALFLAPHNDDETLFGAFTIMREPTRVVVCLSSEIQARRGLPIWAAARRQESWEALRILGVARKDFVQWDDCTDAEPEWETVKARLRSIQDRDKLFAYDVVYAPAVEVGGNEQHSMLGKIAKDVFGERCRAYMTYTTRGRSTSPYEVPISQGEWVTRKLAALSCYRSQIENPGTGAMEHFLRGLREYYEEG